MSSECLKSSISLNSPAPHETRLETAMLLTRPCLHIVRLCHKRVQSSVYISVPWQPMYSSPTEQCCVQLLTRVPTTPTKTRIAQARRICRVPSTDPSSTEDIVSAFLRKGPSG